MKYDLYKIFFFGITVMPMLSCKQEYEPHAVQGPNDYLVVDGTLVDQDTTTIKLSRSRNLGDTAGSRPELNAQVFVNGDAGEMFQLQDQGDGSYTINQLNIHNNQKIQLRILTSEGKEYLSNQLTVKQTPQIDSVSWIQNNTGIQIYVNTHDPLNNTRYYRWDYTETWRYNAKYFSSYDVKEGLIVPRSPDELFYYCWTTNHSKDIKIGSSIRLSEDVIYQYPIAFIPRGSEEVYWKYSILVKQYAVSTEAYNYWQNLQRTTEQTGTIFDPQPSQLKGNMQCTSKPDEPVLGYVDASTLQAKRIFIDYDSLQDWPYFPYYNGCEIKKGTMDSLNIYFPPTGTREFVFLGFEFGAVVYSSSFCGDCRVHGGSNIKPSFWP